MRARIHGGYGTIARDRLDVKRRELYDALAADAPLRDAAGELPPHDALIVRLLAEVLCRLDAVTSYLDLHGELADDGTVRPASALTDRLTGRAMDLADSLGMTPRSRAKLGLDVVRAAGELSLTDYYAQLAEDERPAIEGGDVDG